MTKIKADFITLLVVIAIVSIALLLVPKKYYVLVNNPCAPYEKVIVNGEFARCNSPEQSPANMPIPEGDLPWLRR